MRGVRIAAAVWAAVGLLLVIWFVSALGASAGSDQQYEEKVADARKQQQFWSIVGKEGRGPEGVLSKLAMDLQGMEVKDLYTFRGDSNRYGGISEQLGFDPFNGANCSECGPLDPEVIETAVRIKNGGLADVLVALEPEKPTESDGPGYGLWLIWILGWPVVVGGTYAVEKRRQEHRYASYASELALVESINEALPGLPPAQAYDLRDLSNKLKESVEDRVRYGDEEKRSLKLAELRREAEETLEALAEGNRTIGR